MITYSIIKKSQLEGEHRIDAEYYQPKYLEARKRIEDLGFFNFSEIIKNFNSGKNLWQTENPNYPKFIRTQNVRPILVNNNGMSYCAELKYPKLNYGNLLFVRVGEGVGNSSVVTKNFQNSTFSDNVIKIGIKNINPFYVSVFLNSKVGSLLMKSVKKGSARSLVSKGNLSSLKIPKILNKEQKYFEVIVNQAEKEILNSEKIYSQAENLLLEELGLSKFKVEEDSFYLVNLSDIKNIHRFDAEYFQPKYKKLLNYLKKKFEMNKLRDLVSIKKGIEPGKESYQEEGKSFIRVSNLSKNGFNSNDQKYISDNLYQELKNKYQPVTGEILLSKDATPGIAYVVKEKKEGIISGGILRLKIKTDLEPEYLALLINSLVGQYQMDRDTGGSVIVHWRPEQIKNCLFPILRKPIQKKISNLVIKSYESRKLAMQLLEEAKRKVEEIIEKGEIKNE